jgi:hypothetical protein
VKNCVPRDEKIKQQVLREAHQTKYMIHLGSTKMYKDLKKTFWWNNMRRDIVEYVSKYIICQQIKAEHQRPAGLLQPLLIPEWKWEDINMDFIVRLPKTTRGNDSIWVIVDRLTKVAHFIPYKIGMTLDNLAKLYIKEIVRLHGIPKTITSDRDPRFVSKFWKNLHQSLGTQLKFNTTYHP